MDKLLPCPFCGAMPEIEEIPFMGIGVYCPNCHKQISIVADTTQEAIKAWNTRFREEEKRC